MLLVTETWLMGNEHRAPCGFECSYYVMVHVVPVLMILFFVYASIPPCVFVASGPGLKAWEVCSRPFLEYGLPDGYHANLSIYNLSILNCIDTFDTFVSLSFLVSHTWDQGGPTPQAQELQSMFFFDSLLT